jgi:hypothetical protein
MKAIIQPHTGSDRAAEECIKVFISVSDLKDERCTVFQAGAVWPPSGARALPEKFHPRALQR